jgi:flagellar biosynthesis regulator FlaF
MIMLDGEFDDLSPAEQDAFGLVEAAMALERSRRAAKAELVSALEHNLRLWVSVKTLVERRDEAMPEAVQKNLLRIADFVTGYTLQKGAEISESGIDTLVKINLQISEGLLEGQMRKAA